MKLRQHPDTTKSVLVLLPTIVLFALLTACNPFAGFTNQYKCKIEGKPQPQSVKEYVGRSWEHLYERSGEQECAFGACAEAIRLEPNNAAGYGCRAGVLRMMHKYPAALEDFATAIKIDPNNPIWFANRAILYKEIDDTSHALQDFNTAIQLAPDDRQLSYAYADRAGLLAAQGELDEAIQDLTKAISLQPDFAYHYYDRAKLYAEKGDLQLAANDFDEAIRIDPKNQIFVEARAKIFGEKGVTTVAPSDEASGAPVPSVTPAPRAPVSGGVLNGKAISLPKPQYPPIARTAHASGTVTVQVTVDENGNVISAHAISGHPLLQASAVVAARSARFSPTKLSGVAVKVTGVLTYNFVE